MTNFWYNDELCDLYENTEIKNTLQVNDIAEVKDRQASYTNQFNLPKTARNVRIMQGLGLPSDTSRLQYQKPNCKLKIKGFDIIVKGWAVVSETDIDYKVHVYSGIINFFKAIENKTIGKDLDLSEINHVKNLTTVVNSFSNPNYKYLIADYNGLTHYGTNNEIINIDYLIPSVFVKYLWNKIHSTFGFTYSGSTFTTDAFTNLLITYPKDIAIDNTDVLVEDNQNRYVNNYGNAYNYWRGIFFSDLVNSRTFKAPETAKYRITLNIINSFSNGGIPGGYPVRYFYSVNEENFPWENRNSILLREVPSYNNTINIVSFIELNAGDEISFYDFFEMNGVFTWQSDFELKIEKMIIGEGNFSEELRDFSIPDFVKEVFNHFGLTPFSDEFSNEIRYLTLAERINGATVKDWSEKFIERSSESYIYENYAQQNLFNYQYNDKESTYHNGSLNIDNLNIPEKKTAWISKTYSPEKELTKFFLGLAGFSYLRIFKLYEKEVKDDGTIKYKGLDKRFHFIRVQNLITTAIVGSKTYEEQQTVSSLPLGTFSKLDWTSLLRKNYSEFGRILNDSRLHEISLNLNITDLIHLDLSNLFFFKQEQQYYMLNKLNYGENSSKGEFVRVKRHYDEAIIIDPEDPAEFNLTIVWSDGTNAPKTGAAITQTMQIATMSYPTDDEFVSYEWEIFDGSAWSGLGTGVSPYTATLITGVQKYRLKAVSESSTEIYSNELSYEKLIIICRNYKATLQGYSGDDLTAYFTNCNGQPDTLTTYSTSIGLMELNFCAHEGSVTLNRGTLTDLGSC